MDFSVARENMVDGQLRPNKVNNRDVVARFLTVPRELFVENTEREQAYCDSCISIGANREMFPAMVTGRLIQDLDLQPEDKVMVAAAGTGYTAALIAPQVDKVVAVEENPALVDIAKRSVVDCGCSNISWITSQPEKGYSKEAKYSKIYIDAAVDEVPSTLIDQLEEGGKIAAVQKGDDGLFHATIFTKNGKTLFADSLFETGASLLENFAKKQEFVF